MQLVGASPCPETPFFEVGFLDGMILKMFAQMFIDDNRDERNKEAPCLSLRNVFRSCVDSNAVMKTMGLIGIWNCTVLPGH